MKVLSQSGALPTSIIFAVLLLLCSSAGAQPSKIQRIGAILPGGAWQETIRGLRDGLRDFGFDEGKQFSLTVRETKGDAAATEEIAKAFEQEKVNLLYTTASS